MIVRILRQPSPFNPAEREAIAAYVSAINECQYCLGVHSNGAVSLGLVRDAFDVTGCRPEAPDDPRLTPVLAYVAKLTVDPGSVAKEAAQKRLNAGWSEDAISYAVVLPASMRS